MCFWGIDDPTPLWVTTISELIGESKDGGLNETLLPVFKISWTPSTECSNLTILGGRVPGQTTLSTLVFSNASLSSVDQLVPTSNRIYEELGTRDIKDFVVLTESDQVLVLDSAAQITRVNLANNSSESSIPYLPFLLRPPIVSLETILVSTQASKTLLAGDKPLSALVKGGISRPVIRTDGPDPRLSKV